MQNSQKYSVDAISGATPMVNHLKFKTVVDSGAVWKYYVEVNVSGDYNNDFPKYLDGGIPDSEVNGQPSLIYCGTIASIPGQHGKSQLIGRTDQITASSKIVSDLGGITSARQLLKKINVSVSK